MKVMFFEKVTSLFNFSSYNIAQLIPDYYIRVVIIVIKDLYQLNIFIS